MNGPDGRWHQGSRFWRYGLWVVVASDVLGLVALVWRPEAAGAALGAAGAVSTAFLATAGGTNMAERWRTQTSPTWDSSESQERPYPEEGSDD